MITLPEMPPRNTGGVNRSFATMRAVVALMMREMATRYGRSPGGYVWALLEPIGAIVILAIGFSMLLRSPPVGNSFVLFYATGFLPFTLYQSLQTMVARSIIFSRPLLMYPAVTWIDAVLARFILNALTSLLATIILFAGILLFSDARAVIEITFILKSLALGMLLGLSVGLLNCALFGLLPVWEQIWSIATRPLFLISGVFFTFDSMPRMMQSILWYNPLMHIVGAMRKGFYPTYSGDYINLSYVLGVCLVLMFFGVVLLCRFHRDILNNN